MRRPVCLAALLFAAAVWAAVLIHPARERIDERADGRSVTVTGTVERKEYARNSSESLSLQMTLGNIRVESGIPAEIGFDVFSGDKILCLISEDTALQESWAREGASVRVRGKLRLFRRPANDGEFDAFLYYSQIRGLLFSLSDARILAYSDARAPLKSRLYAVRQVLSDALDQIYGETSAIMKALLLGQTSLLDEEQKDRYQSAGIIHVLCISGVHLSLIGTAIFSLLRRTGIPTPLSGAVSITFLFLYGLLTGMHTSCVRALIMFSFRAAAKALGRTYDIMTALSVAAVLLLLEQPGYLYHSGFLFSFAAVIAIALVSEAFPKRTAPLLIPVCTLPVQLSFYYTFPLYSVFLNLVVISLAPFLIAGGLLSLIPYLLALTLSGGAGSLSSLLFNASRLTGMIPALILRLFDRLCAAAENLPFHTLIPGKPAFWLVVVYYLLIAAATVIGLYRNRFENCGSPLIRDQSGKGLMIPVISSDLWKTAAAQAVLITVAVVLILRVRCKPPLSLYMLDVGQGDGLCIMAHDGSGDSCILVDGGSSSRQGIGKYVEIPFLKYHGVSQIDCCVVTHDDLDHCNGVLELLDQHGDANGIRIGSVALPSIVNERKGKLYLQIEETAKRKEIPVLYLSKGMAFSPGELGIECIHPGQNADYEDSNAYSVVLLLTYRDFSAVLTGDLEGDGERDLLTSLKQRQIDADILKVAHHGSAGGTSKDFLRKIGARTALISCGQDNPYGHPSPETVSRLLEAGMKVYDTRRTGQISILTDGLKSYSVKLFYTQK